MPEPATDWTKRLIEVATLAVISAGLYFGFDQARRLRDSIDIATSTELFKQELEVDKLFIDRPEYRKYFYESASISKDNPNYGRVASMAEYLLDFVDSYGPRAQYIKSSTASPQLWQVYFKELFEQSPIMCDLLSSSEDEYSCPTIILAHRNCHEPDVSLPPRCQPD